METPLETNTVTIRFYGTDDVIVCLDGDDACANQINLQSQTFAVIGGRYMTWLVSQYCRSVRWDNIRGILVYLFL